MAAASGKKKGFKAGLPILGLVLAIALGALSYGLATVAVPELEARQPDLKQDFNDLRNDQSNEFLQDNIIELIFAGVIWLVLMAVAMFVVSASLMGKSPEKEVWNNMPVSPADKKGMVKQMKKDLRQAKKKAKQQKQRNKNKQS
ncbi:MAG: hypothetical protein JXA10_08385 [Anaerolineae bacterium]|nr:hypothetical protein [Anaerolineae bacterium]